MSRGREDDYRLLSELAYRKPDDRDHAGGLGYTYIPQYSTDTRAVYRDGDGRVVIAYRGTSSLKDVGADMFLAVGGKPPRYKTEARAAANIASQLGVDPADISVVGHSLGGGVARYVSEQTGAEGFGYNAAPETYKGFAEKAPDNWREYRATFDPVSALSLVGKSKDKVVNVSTDNPLFAQHGIKSLESVDLPPSDMEVDRVSRDRRLVRRRLEYGAEQRSRSSSRGSEQRFRRPPPVGMGGGSVRVRRAISDFRHAIRGKYPFHLMSDMSRSRQLMPVYDSYEVVMGGGIPEHMRVSARPYSRFKY